MLLNAHTWSNLHTFSHTQPLHNSHLNTKYLIAKLQVNLTRNKANTWLNKFNLTHTSLCHFDLLIACSDDHLVYYVIIVVISLWLFWCMIKLLTCFTSYLLDCILLVTLYLSFYYSLYLKGLMCFVQMFQVTGIYVPCSS